MLTVAMASCQDENMADITATMPNSLRATMSGWGVESRAQVELGNQQEAQEIFQWNAGDGFSLIDLDSEAKTAVRYEIAGYNADEPSATAEFVGKGELTQGHKLLAIYPQGEMVDGKVPLTVEQNTTSTANTQEEIISYMTKNMVMIAKGFVGETQTDLKFSQATAMVRVSLTNAKAEPMTVSSVSVTSPGAFGLVGEYNTADGTVSLTGTAADVMTQEFSGLTIASGSAVDFYFLALPGSGIGDFEIAVNDEKVTVPASEFADKGIEKLEAGNRYWFQLIEGNNGLLRKASVGEGVITNLPLIKAIEAEVYNCEFVRNADGFVDVKANKEQIEKVEYLQFDGGQYGVTDLDGIGYFTNLKTFWIWNTPLQVADMSSNITLEDLAIKGPWEHHDIKSINIDGLKNLKRLEIENANLPTIDLSSCDSLTHLLIRDAELESIDLSNLTELEDLDLGYNRLTELNVTNNAKLEFLFCTGMNNAIAELNLSNNRELKRLGFGSNYTAVSSPIKNIDLSNNTKLESLDISECWELEPIDLSIFPNLKSLRLEDCFKFTNIDLSNNQELQSLTLFIPIENLDISNNRKLEEIHMGWIDSLKQLDVQQNTELKKLWFYGCGISEIDLSKNLLLEDIHCRESKLTSLDVSMLMNLRELNCGRCYLTELDITKNTALEKIECGDQRDPASDSWDAYRELTLILTAAQEAMWKDQETWGNHVTLKVEE